MQAPSLSLLATWQRDWQVRHLSQQQAIDDEIWLQLIHTPLLIFNNDLIQVMSV